MNFNDLFKTQSIHFNTWIKEDQCHLRTVQLSTGDQKYLFNLIVSGNFTDTDKITALVYLSQNKNLCPKTQKRIIEFDKFIKLSKKNKIMTKKVFCENLAKNCDLLSDKTLKLLMNKFKCRRLMAFYTKKVEILNRLSEDKSDRVRAVILENKIILDHPEILNKLANDIDPDVARSAKQWVEALANNSYDQDVIDLIFAQESPSFVDNFFPFYLSDD